MPRIKYLVFALLVLAGSSALSKATPTNYDITTVSAPAGFNSLMVVDVNEFGAIAGTLIKKIDGSGIPSGVFTWQSGSFAVKDDSPSFTNPSARTLSNTSLVAGEAYIKTGTSSSATFKPIVWSNSSATVLPTPSLNYSDRAIRYNSNGQLLTNSYIFGENGIEYSFPESRAQNQSINDLGHVVGYSPEGRYQNPTGFLFRNGASILLGNPGGSCFVQQNRSCLASSIAYDVNNTDQVVGSYIPPTYSVGIPLDYIQHAYLWEDGDFVDLGTLGRQDERTTATAINDDGLVVGNSISSARTTGFLWHSTSGMIDLNDLLPESFEYIKITSAIDINETGQILAQGQDTRNGNAVIGILLSPVSLVPEPSTSALLLVGLLAFHRQKKLPLSHNSWSKVA